MFSLLWVHMRTNDCLDDFDAYLAHLEFHPHQDLVHPVTPGVVKEPNAPLNLWCWLDSCIFCVSFFISSQQVYGAYVNPDIFSLNFSFLSLPKNLVGLRLGEKIYFFLLNVISWRINKTFLANKKIVFEFLMVLYSLYKILPIFNI